MERKQPLRQSYREQRNTFSKQELELASARITQRLVRLPAFLNAKTVLCYASFGSETITDDIIAWLHTHNRRVCLPVSRPDGTMYAAQVYGECDLRVGRLGVLEPPSSCPVVPPQEIDLVLVPGLAFDRAGYRIGYGKGYYDRFLPQCTCAVSIGLCFGSQLSAEPLPREAYDWPVGYIITEEEIIRCNQPL